MSDAPRAPDGVTVIDALVYAGTSLFGGGRTLDELHTEAATLGLAGLVAAPARPPDHDLARASRELARGCATTGDRALARLDPWDDGAPRALVELIEGDNVSGLLLHPWEEHSAQTTRARSPSRAWRPKQG